MKTKLVISVEIGPRYTLTAALQKFLNEGYEFLTILNHHVYFVKETYIQ